MAKVLTLEDVKNKLRILAGDIYIIPEDFEIKDEYLNGLSKQEFIKAFSEYRSIIVEMYRSAAVKPSEYGFSSINKNSGEERLYDEFTSGLTYMDKFAVIHHLIIKICDASKLENGALEADVDKLKQLVNTAPRIKNADRLLNRLSEFGFVLSGFGGRLSTTKTLSMTHSRNKNIVNVMKSFSGSKFAKLAMEFDYAHFNYMLLSIGKDENLQLSDSFVFNSLSDKTRKFLVGFNASMNKQGYYYGECATSGFCWGSSQFAYSKAPEKKKDYVCRLYQREDSLAVRLYLKNVNSYSGYIEGAPEHIKDVFVNDTGKCNYCKEKCGHRKTYTISGKEYNKCDGCVFEFYNLEPESIEHYVNLIVLSEKSKKT